MNEGAGYLAWVHGLWVQESRCARPHRPGEADEDANLRKDAHERAEAARAARRTAEAVT